MMKDTFQEVCSFNSTCVDLSGPLVLGLSDQKFLVASAHSWQVLYTCEVIERIMFFFFLSYSSFCLCGMYVMVHGKEGFLETQVTSEHYYIWNSIVSIETLNQTGPERFPVNLNQHTVGKFAAMCASAQLSVLSGLGSVGIITEVITKTHGFSQADTDMCNLLMLCSNMIHIYTCHW